MCDVANERSANQANLGSEYGANVACVHDRDVLEVPTGDSIYYQFILPLLRSDQERLFAFAILKNIFYSAICNTVTQENRQLRWLGVGMG
jgi:hypothetical protein